MVPEAAYVPFGVQRIIRSLFSFYATARANDILRFRALVTVSIILYNIYDKCICQCENHMYFHG